MFNSSCSKPDDSRTQWNIIYSCVLTVFACTWLAIHPNIPDQREGQVRRFFRRTRLMIMAVIAPELVIVWATRQWLVARRLAKYWESTCPSRMHRFMSDIERPIGERWTETHGFFALMGGFALCDENYELTRTLNPDEDFDRLDSRMFPHITEEQIQDKSKADFLAKGLVILQTGWFVVQCIARKAACLHITELEIVTCAFAALNFFTYALWWNKPFNVDCPHLIRYRPARDRHREASSSTMVEMIPLPVGQTDTEVGATTLHQSGLAFVSAQAKDYVTQSKAGDIFDDVMDTIMVPFRPFVEMATGEVRREHDWKSVPPFHAGALTYHEEKMLVYFSLSIAMVFGAIHCIAWIFEFPSTTEKIMWQVSSLVITCVPFYGMLVVSIYKWSEAPAWLDSTYKFTSVVSCVLYALSRIILLTIAFTSLRNLQAAELQAVSWTNYIPHL
ncbi:hypothetical protein NEOLEDRAFT_1142071 [Neolentinus lepideus HHB14362 ss-1]|uniref:Uncharacterized protein n=1 Tax=Neolentinus lepideus HHB14362 ss-1 TaxID=1314782 RepID=A0A165NB22_9AGAM|nr:hypothetical protein NEOLEDRAFT_1142071 [Neolentinus lepideus HHB14362 ss-1]